MDSIDFLLDVPAEVVVAVAAAFFVTAIFIYLFIYLDGWMDGWMFMFICFYYFSWILGRSKGGCLAVRFSRSLLYKKNMQPEPEQATATSTSTSITTSINSNNSNSNNNNNTLNGGKKRMTVSALTKSLPPPPPPSSTSSPPPQEGALIWAKVRGYPWWPGKILHHTNLPSALLKRPKPPLSCPVIFYGTLEYAWVPEKDCRGYEEHKAVFEGMWQQFGSHGSLLKKAIRQVKEEPGVADIDFTVTIVSIHEQEEEEEENEEENEEGESEVGSSGVRVGKKRGRPRKSDVSAVSVSVSGEQGEKKSKRVKVVSSSTSSSSKNTLKVSGTSSTQNSNISGSTGGADGGKSTHDRLLSLRHRLQRIFLGDTIRIEDFHKVDSLMSQIEQFPVTFDLLRDTKIGKVVKRVAGLSIGGASAASNDNGASGGAGEPAGVCGRCAELLNKWRRQFTSSSGATANEVSTGSANVSTNVENVKVSSASATNINNNSNNNNSNEGGDSISESVVNTAAADGDEIHVAQSGDAKPLVVGGGESVHQEQVQQQ